MRAVSWLMCSSMMAGAAWAQLQKATPEELAARRGGGGGGGGGAAASAMTVRASSADPRDFSGVWRQARGAAAAGAASGRGAAGLVTAPTNAIDPNLNPEGNRGSVGRLPDRVLCMPQGDPTYVGVDGPTLIVQTPEQIVWAAEEMHHIRRIFLDGGRAASARSSYLGEALGRWDGNTLVIETRNLRKLPPGAALVERWSKAADGSQVKIEYGNVDAKGQALSETRTLTLGWAGGQQVMEWLCEDYNDEWLPGGTDYDDQLAR
jgi:hypothetical protein